MQQNNGTKNPRSPHEMHDFMRIAQRRMQEAYERIQKRAKEDPGTAGDQGEENWANFFREWLPPYFHVVTKGRILAPSGVASPQVDVLILMPSYPKVLLSEKLYMAAGVAAVFECKTTLKADHIRSAMDTAAAIRREIPQRVGSPYKELNSPLVFGLLAHSHVWKEQNSKPLENIGTILFETHVKFVEHPREAMDILCVADLATWSLTKFNYVSPQKFSTPEMAAMYGGRPSSGYLCHAINAERQETYFSPLGNLFSSLYHKFAWMFVDMRNLDLYFRDVNLIGSGVGMSRHWDTSIYSEKTKAKILSEGCHNPGEPFDEWSLVFI